ASDVGEAFEVVCQHEVLRVGLLAADVQLGVELGHPCRTSSLSTISRRRFLSDDVGTGRLVRGGNSSQVRPLSTRPLRLFWTPPHCLKKNGTLAARHCFWIETTHSGCMGRAPGPLSPPTMTQSMSVSSISSRSSRRGSMDR